MTDPFRIAPQNIPGGDIAKVLAAVNKNLRDLRRDVTRLPVVLDVPTNIQSNFGTTQAITLISSTINGGIISPPARGIRLEAYGQIQNHTGATATFEISAVWGGVTASVITASIDDVGASTTIRHLTYALDITRGRTQLTQPSAGTEGSTYDGTFSYARRGANLAGNGDSARAIVSFWFRRRSITTNQRAWGTQQPASNGNRFFVEFDAGSPDVNDKIRIFADGGGATILDAHTTATTDTASWHHFLAGFDLSGTLTLDMYLDDARTSSSVTVLLTGTVDFSDPTYDHFVGAFNPAGAFQRLLNADISGLYINYGEFLDFNVEANRRFFNDGAGNPVDFGTTGQTPTGNSPLVYCPDGNPARNFGTGGDFSDYGQIDPITGPTPTAPPDVGQVYRAQLQISNVAVNAAQPARDTMIDLKTIYAATSVPDLEDVLALQITGKSSAASPGTGIDIFRARIDLV